MQMNIRFIVFLLFFFRLTPCFSAELNIEHSPEEYSKHIDVAELDAALPSTSLYDWLNGLAKASERVAWEFNDCGEQTGTEADRGRDFPKCLEGSIVSSTTHASILGIQVCVGTWQKGITGKPKIRLIYYTGQSTMDIQSLSALKKVAAGAKAEK